MQIIKDSSNTTIIALRPPGIIDIYVMILVAGDTKKREGIFLDSSRVCVCVIPHVARAST